MRVCVRQVLGFHDSVRDISLGSDCFICSCSFVRCAVHLSCGKGMLQFVWVTMCTFQYSLPEGKIDWLCCGCMFMSGRRSVDMMWMLYSVDVVFVAKF